MNIKKLIVVCALSGATPLAGTSRITLYSGKKRYVTIPATVLIANHIAHRCKDSVRTYIGTPLAYTSEKLYGLSSGIIQATPALIAQTPDVVQTTCYAGYASLLTAYLRVDRAQQKVRHTLDHYATRIHRTHKNSMRTIKPYAKKVGRCLYNSCAWTYKNPKKAGAIGVGIITAYKTPQLWRKLKTWYEQPNN